MVAAVGVCVTQGPIILRAFLSYTLIFEPAEQGTTELHAVR